MRLTAAQLSALLEGLDWRRGARIVGKRVSRHRHGRIRPYSPTARDNGIQADSLRRGSARLNRNAGPARLELKAVA
jgi:hypothetical protein